MDESMTLFKEIANSAVFQKTPIILLVSWEKKNWESFKEKREFHVSFIELYKRIKHFVFVSNQLNKADLFREKLARLPLNTCFPEYDVRLSSLSK